MGCKFRSEGGSCSRMAAITPAWLLPSNARRPLSISSSTAPNANKSDRASASFPSSCSGAMYCRVPRIVPAPVSGAAAVTVSICVAAAPVDAGNPGRPRRHLRQPEIQHLHSAGRQHDVARLQVPVHDPRTVRLIQSVGNLDGGLNRLRHRHRPALQPRRQRLAFHVLQHQVIRAVLGADIVQRADAWMVQRRSRPRLAFEAFPRFARFRQPCRQHLDGNGALQSHIPRLPHLSHSARAQRRHNFIRSQSVSGSQRHWSDEMISSPRLAHAFHLPAGSPPRQAAGAFGS